MTVSSDVSQLLGLLGQLLQELPPGNRSGASTTTQDSSFADLLSQLATDLDDMADGPVSQGTAPLQASAQALAPSIAAPVASTSQTSTETTAPSHALSVESQEFFSIPEMNSCGGRVSFCNLTGNSADVLSVGDTWQFSIHGGPPNTPVKQLMDCWTYPPPFKTVGTTDAQGNFTLTGTVTEAQGGSQVWQPLYMEFPNTYPGYQDPTAPTGYRNVFIGGAEFSVQQPQS